MHLRVLSILCFLCFACAKNENAVADQAPVTELAVPHITILGIAQDGGFPHINNPSEFDAVEKGLKHKEKVVSLGLIDPKTEKKYLFEATPDMPSQLNDLATIMPSESIVDGIFLTHAHMGHYTGLMHLGREALGGQQIPVFAMPRMESFLKTNGPWSQLVELGNIKIISQQDNQKAILTPSLMVTPFIVPHRDEFSETVGYRIQGPNHTALFIPDIDKWTAWETDILKEVAKVDYAFIDATFYAEGEIPRPMSEVPHPFIEETVALFAKANRATKSKIIFIHFNHSNPLLDEQHPNRLALEKEGFRFAREGDVYGL